MATINHIKFLFITISFVVSMLTISVLGSAEMGHYHTSPSPPPPPPPPLQTSAQSPESSCQEFAQLCAGYGSYDCCKGLVCRVPPIGVGAFACLPPLPTKLVHNKDHGLPRPVAVPTSEGINQIPTGKTPTKYEKCQQIGDLCNRFGEYTCCQGLNCVYPPQLVGLGVCLPKEVPVLPKVDRAVNGLPKCQKVGQICEKYGPTTCCEGLRCHIIKPAIGTAVCTPI